MQADPSQVDRQASFANSKTIVSSIDLPSLIADSQDTSEPDTESAVWVEDELFEPPAPSRRISRDTPSFHFPHRLSNITEHSEPASPQEQYRDRPDSFEMQQPRESEEWMTDSEGSLTPRGEEENPFQTPRASAVYDPSSQWTTQSTLDYESAGSTENHTTAASTPERSPKSRTKQPRQSNESSRTSSSSARAYPIPRWTIPQSPHPPPAPGRKETPSWATVITETSSSQTSLPPTTPATIRIPKRTAPHLRLPSRPETPIGRIETALQQETLQVASLLGAPEPKLNPRARPTSFHQRVCRAIEQHEAPLVLADPSTTNFATQAKTRNQSPLDNLAARLQDLTTTASGLEKLRTDLNGTWQVADSGAAYTQAKYQIASEIGGERSVRVPSFVQCPKRSHQFYPIYPKQFFGMGMGNDGLNSGSIRAAEMVRQQFTLRPLSLLGDGSLGLDLHLDEVHERDRISEMDLVSGTTELTELPALCDVCNKIITRTRWVCRVEECGVEACTECKKVLERT